MRAGLADAIDAAWNVVFDELRTGAAELVPAAGVDHQDAAIGVFDDVGGMKVSVVRGDQIMVFSGKRGSRRLQDMPTDFAEIELTREDVIAIVGPELIGFVA